jgi:hypothetical protein
MKKYLHDPVLNLTAGALRVIRWGVLAFAGLALVMAAFAAVIGLVAPGLELTDPATKLAIDVKTSDILPMLGLMGAAAVLLYLFSLFLKALHHLVLSVETGQPLTMVNAGRLRLMGWLSLSIQLLVLCMVPFGLLGDYPLFDVDTIVDLVEGTIITGVLFILARVFEHGARIQDELEGTV